MTVTDTTEVLGEAIIDPVTGEIIDQKELAERLLAQAEEQGVSLVGPGGLLSQLTKSVLETALEAELTEHLGYEHGGTPIAENMRNGTRTKTVLTPDRAGGDRSSSGPGRLVRTGHRPETQTPGRRDRSDRALVDRPCVDHR